MCECVFVCVCKVQKMPAAAMAVNKCKNIWHLKCCQTNTTNVEESFTRSATNSGSNNGTVHTECTCNSSNNNDDDDEGTLKSSAWVKNCG